MFNGKTYRIFKALKNYSLEDYYYYRTDSSHIYQYYNDSLLCVDREYKNYDFVLTDSTIWEICRDEGFCGNARGISGTFYDYTYYNFLQKPLETKHFQDVYVDFSDTIWTPCEGREYWLSKAIGIIRIFIFNDGDYWLQGAIIDGQQFGTLVSVDNFQNLIPSSFQISAYPNPFNSIVTLNFTLPTSGITEISLYNMLGEKISTLLSDYKNSGSYSNSYNASKLSSGIYLVLLTQGSKNSIKKIILLK